MVVLLVAFLAMTSFAFLYVGSRGEPVTLKSDNVVREPVEIIDYGATPVFAENMRFNHNIISYFIEADCSFIRRRSMIEAFNLFDEKMGLISFYEVGGDADINVGCSDDYIKLGEDLFAAGEGGPSRIINTSVFKTIEAGKILLYENSRCKNPVVELHELCHVFGFDHSNDPMNIMYNISDCEQEISEDMIELMDALYSIEALPDASISNLSAVKKGRYLSFNVSILNEGLVGIDEIVLSIVVDGDEIQSMNLGEIGIGYGRTLRAENVRLPSSGVEKIDFVVDRAGLVREFNEGNNQVSVVS